MILHAMKNVSKKDLTIEARQLDFVILAVHALGGDQRSIDTEDIAVKCHELAPGLFSWRKYPELPNLEIVRVVLSNAKKGQYGTLLSGSGREGWRLSANGLSWMASRGKELQKAGVHWSNDKRKAGSVDTQRKQREKKRLLSSPALESWNNGTPVSVRDARNLFRIDEYSTGKMLEIKVVRLQSLFTDDADISRFLKNAGNLVLETGED